MIDVQGNWEGGVRGTTAVRADWGEGGAVGKWDQARVGEGQGPDFQAEFWREEGEEREAWRIGVGCRRLE